MESIIARGGGRWYLGILAMCGSFTLSLIMLAFACRRGRHEPVSIVARWFLRVSFCRQLGQCRLCRAQGANPLTQGWQPHHPGSEIHFCQRKSRARRRSIRKGRHFPRHRYFRQHRIVCRRGFGRGRSTAGNFRISHAADLDRRHESRQGAPATKPAQLDPRRRSRRGAAFASSTQSRHGSVY